MRKLIAAALLCAAATQGHASPLAMTWTADGHVEWSVAFDPRGAQVTQGIAWNDQAEEWATSWQYGLGRFDPSFNLIKTNGSVGIGASGIEIANGIPDVLSEQGYDHIGDFFVRSGMIYASLDNTEDYDTPAVALFDGQTLEYTGRLFSVTGAPDNPQDDVASWFAFDADAKLAYGKEWRAGSTLNIYDPDSWEFLGTLEMDMELSRIQGAAVVDGVLYMSRDNEGGSIYAVDLSTGHVEEVLKLGTASNDEVEGIGLRKRDDGTLEMVVEAVIGDDDLLTATGRVYTFLGAVGDDGASKVPPPASLPLALGGVAALGVLRRRRRRAA